MNEELNEWQSLWQGQEGVEDEYDVLIHRLNENEEKIRKERRRLVVLFPLTMLVLLAMLLLLPKAPLYIIGISLIGLAMLMMIYLSYKNKVDPIQGEQALTNKDFLKDYVQKLRGRKLMTSRYMWIYNILLVLGLNIGYLDVLRPAEPVFRILGHLVVTLVLPIGNYFAIRKKMKQYKEELDPLIEQLEGLEREE